MPDNQDPWAFLDKVEMPNEGVDPPSMEKIKEPVQDGESPVLLQKIVTEVYVYTHLDGDGSWYGSKSFQDVQIIGQMRLADAAAIINAQRKKRRRK